MYKIYCRIFQNVMKVAAYILPWRKPHILEGAGCILNLPERIIARKIKSVLLVSDKAIMSLGLPNALLAALEESEIKVTIYDETVPNPTIDNIEEALVLYKQNECGGIIAFGGGSVIDCAKGVGVRVVRPRTKIARMKGLLKVIRRIPPLFAVPTTSGTGSEATLATVVVDSKLNDKYAIMDPATFPHEAVLDPLLTVGLPPNITATTGMDTLTHAVEAYIGNSNTRETREMARKAVKLVFENIYKAYEDGANVEARGNMQKAAYYGGVAFTRAYVGNVHAIAHTLGGLYNTPHGLANAVILPIVLEDYGKKVYKKLAKLARFAGVATGGDDEADAKAFIAAVRTFNSNMKIPERFDFIKDEDIPQMVKWAAEEANPIYPVPVVYDGARFAKAIQKIRRPANT